MSVIHSKALKKKIFALQQSIIRLPDIQVYHPFKENEEYFSEQMSFELMLQSQWTE